MRKYHSTSNNLLNDLKIEEFREHASIKKEILQIELQRIDLVNIELGSLADNLSFEIKNMQNLDIFNNTLKTFLNPLQDFIIQSSHCDFEKHEATLQATRKEPTRHYPAIRAFAIGTKSCSADVIQSYPRWILIF